MKIEELYREIEQMIKVHNDERSHLERTKKRKLIDEKLDRLGVLIEKLSNQKKTGSYFTKDLVTAHIVSKTIEEWFQCNFNPLFKLSRKYLKSLNDKEQLELRKVTRKLKICDPSAGSGQFLVTCFREIEFIYSQLDKISTMKNDVMYKCICNSLFAFDISSEFLSHFKRRMGLEFKVRGVKEHEILCSAGDTLHLDGYDNFFDIIVGNPPYIELNKYSLDIPHGRIPSKGNIYMMFIDKSIAMLNSGGTIGMVVPMSLQSTARAKPTLDLMEDKFSTIILESYADRPGCLFTGVHQRLNIFICSQTKKGKYVTGYNMWKSAELSKMLKSMKYVKTNDLNTRLDSSMSRPILNKVFKRKHLHLDDFKIETNYVLSASTRLGLWAKSFIEPVKSSEFKSIYCLDAKTSKAYMAILSSGLFYYTWTLLSDCWHVNNKYIQMFMFDLSKEEKDKLSRLGSRLSAKLESTKKWIGSKQVEYEYKHKMCKKEIDSIDRELGKMLNLTEKQINEIINYKLKYRMNTEVKNG